MDKKFIVSCFVSLLICLSFYLQPYKLIVIVGQSMMPTLRNGQIVLAKRENKYNRGDIVVINDTSEDAIIVKIDALVVGVVPAQRVTTCRWTGAPALRTLV